MSKGIKEDVLLNVTVELNMMLDLLRAHYEKPQFDIGFAEFEKIEAFLKASLAEYDPDSRGLG